MNTRTISPVAPLFTVAAASTGEHAKWMSTETVFVAHNRPSADDCALAMRRYDAAGEWADEITGEWRVVRHEEPFTVEIFAKHARACSALRDIKAERKVTARLDRVPEGYALVVTGHA